MVEWPKCLPGKDECGFNPWCHPHTWCWQFCCLCPDHPGLRKSFRLGPSQLCASTSAKQGQPQVRTATTMTCKHHCWELSSPSSKHWYQKAHEAIFSKHLCKYYCKKKCKPRNHHSQIGKKYNQQYPRRKGRNERKECFLFVFFSFMVYEHISYISIGRHVWDSG